MARTNLNFHLTFKPERQYLCSLLAEVSNCNGMDIQGISNQTGIPTGKSSGKVEPTISYANYMGLLIKEKKDGKYEIKYTALGECVKNEDAGLLEKLSLLILHCMIVRPFGGAELWAYIFHHVFPKYRNQLTLSQFDKEIELKFGAGVKIAPFNGSYKDLFGPLNLINENGEQLVLNNIKIDSDFVYLYAFVLFTYWDEWLNNASADETKMASYTEITADHLNAIGFKNPFGWSDKDEYKVLEMMANKGLIALNRQMVPFIVRRITDVQFIVDELYSKLC